MEDEKKDILSQELNNFVSEVCSFNDNIFNISVRPVDLILEHSYSKEELLNPTKDLIEERVELSMLFSHTSNDKEKLTAFITKRNGSIEKLNDLVAKYKKWLHLYDKYSPSSKPQRMVCSRDFIWLLYDQEMLKNEKSMLNPGDTLIKLDNNYFKNVDIIQHDKFIARKYFDKGGTKEQVEIFDNKLKEVNKGYDNPQAFTRPDRDIVDSIDYLLDDSNIDTEISAKLDSINSITVENTLKIASTIDEDLLSSDLLKEYDLYMASGDIESNVLAIYDLLFTPCFIAEPVGVITYNPDKEGHGGLVVKRDSKLQYERSSEKYNARLDRLCNFFINYGNTQENKKQRIKESKMFEVSQAKNSKEIASDLVEYWMKHRDQELRVLTFPFLMAEFAFGFRHVHDTQYEKVDLGWAEYKNTIVQPKIKEIISWCKYEFIERNKDNSDFIIDFGGEVLGYVGECLSTIEILTVLDKVNPQSENWIQFSVLCSDSRGFTKDKETGEVKELTKQFTKYFERGFYNPDKGNLPQPLNLYKPKNKSISKSAVVEYRVVYDYLTVEKTPIFAYQAVNNNIKNGILPFWDKLPIGKLDNGSPVYHKFIQNGTMNHFVIAGSRAGKGVTTLSFLAAAMINKRPIVYFDNKPDMFSTMFDLGQTVGLQPWEMFLVEGPAQSESDDNSIDGTRKGVFTDYVKNYLNDGKLVGITDTNGHDIIPKYIDDVFTHTLGWLGNDYEKYGELIYFKALIFITGMLGFLTRSGYELGGDPSGLYTDLKDRGMCVVVDEVSALIQGFRNKSLSMFDNVACLKGQKNSNYAKYSQSDKEEDKEALLSAMGPDKIYLELLLESFAKTGNQVGQWELKGKDDAGVRRADIFTIGQHFNFAPTPYTLQSVLDNGRLLMFKPGVKTDYRKFDLGDFIMGLLSYKKSDAIIGYNMVDTIYLDQNNPDSPASSKLNEDARGFAYIPTFDYTSKIASDFNQAIGDDKIGRGASMPMDVSDNMKKRMLGYAKIKDIDYFKPYLILNSHVGGPTGFLKNSLFKNENPEDDCIDRKDFLLKYGSKKQIEAINANPDRFVPKDEMDFAEGLGFYGYMNTICQTLNEPEIAAKWVAKAKFEAPVNADEAIKYALSRPAKAACYVIKDVLGYPCTEETWFNFFIDMRPEWFFTAEDIELAFRYGDKEPQRLQNIDGTQRFYKLLDPSNAKINSILKYWGNTEWKNEDYSNTLNQQPKQGLGNLEVGEVVSSGFTFEGMEDIQPNNPMTGEELLGDSSINTDNNIIEGEDTDPFTKFVEAYSDIYEPETDQDNNPNQEFTNNTDRTPNFSSLDSTSTFTEPQFEPTNQPINKPIEQVKNPPALTVQAPKESNAATQKAASMLNQSMKPTRETRAESDYKYYEAEIEALTTPSIDTIDYPITVDKRGGMVMGADLVPVITRAVILNAGGLDKIKTLSITADEHLIINGKTMKTVWNNESEAVIGQGYAELIETGRIATLFDYSLLLHYDCNNIEKIVFKDSNFAEEYVNPFLQKPAGSKFDIDLMFKAQRKLQMLVLGNKVFKRSDYKQKIQDYDSEYRTFGFFSGLKLFHNKIGQKGWQCVGKTYKGAFRQFSEGHFLKGIGGIIGGTLFTSGIVAGNIVAGATGTAMGTAKKGHTYAKRFKGMLTAGNTLSNRGVYTSSDAERLGYVNNPNGTNNNDREVWTNAMFEQDRDSGF